MSRYTTSRRASSGSTHQHQHHHQNSGTASAGSSPRSQRPRLLRSSATTPAITASSSEIQASLVSPNSPHTAADLLNKMAYVPSSYYLGQTVQQQQERSEATCQPIDFERERSGSTESYTPGNSVDEGSYFSFPNFDNWESSEEKHEGE